MRPQTVTVTGVADSAWIPVDHRQGPFSLSFACVISGTATYKVQYCLDNVLAGETPVAFDHSAATSANLASNFAFPITAIRLSVSASTGSVTMKVHNPTNT